MVRKILIMFLTSAVGLCAQDKKELSFSSFAEIPMSKLVGGEILSNRTPVDLSTAMTVETLSFIPKPPEEVVQALMKWDPTSHRDMGIIVHKQIGVPAKENDFESFTIDTKNDEEKWFFEQSIKAKGGKTKLNVTQKDISRLSKAKESAGSIAAAWKAVLLAKAEACQTDGYDAMDSYKGGEESFSLEKEIPSFMSRLSKVNVKFKELLGIMKEKDRRMAENEEVKGDELLAAYYWEKIKANNQTAVVLGMIKARQTGDAWQVSDLQYYVSSNYYASLILYDIVPAKGGSLMWRGDYILTPEVLEMKGVERVFSDNILIKEVKKSINYFRKDLGK